MSPDKKPVEHLQAKPYNPHSPRNQRQSAKILLSQQRTSSKRNPLVGYLMLFLITALLATAILFGFVILLALFATLLPIWLIVRFVRGKRKA